MRRRAARAYWPDEEPDAEDQPRADFGVYLAAVAGSCSYCGQPDHEKPACPARPIGEL